MKKVQMGLSCLLAACGLFAVMGTSCPTNTSGGGTNAGIDPAAAQKACQNIKGATVGKKAAKKGTLAYAAQCDVNGVIMSGGDPYVTDSSAKDNTSVETCTCPTTSAQCWTGKACVPVKPSFTAQCSDVALQKDQKLCEAAVTANGCVFTVGTVVKTKCVDIPKLCVDFNGLILEDDQLNSLCGNEKNVTKMKYQCVIKGPRCIGDCHMPSADLDCEDIDEVVAGKTSCAPVAGTGIDPAAVKALCESNGTEGGPCHFFSGKIALKDCNTAGTEDDCAIRKFGSDGGQCIWGNK